MNCGPSLRSLGALVLLAAGLVGCAGAAGRRDVSSWMEARGADLMDVFGLRLAAGVGVGGWVRVTEYAQLGFMVRGPAESRLVIASETARPDDFRVRGLPCLVVGTIGRYGGVWYEGTSEVYLPGWSNRDGPTSPVLRDPIAGVVPLDGRADNWRHSIGVGAHLLLAGAEFELRPFEAVDFVAGLLSGYDPSGDDVPVDAGSDARN